MATPRNSNPSNHERSPAQSHAPKPDALDDAISMDELEAGEEDDAESDELLSDDERNAAGGALPYSDDGDNDNDDDDARERALPDHLRRDKDDVPE
jgi:hypothetical protein